MTKVFMITSFFLIALASCSDKQNSLSDKAVLEGPFIIKNGIRYDQMSNKPITGVVDEILTETTEGKRSYVDGRLEGPFERYRNGSLVEKGFYRAGKQHGYFETYYDLLFPVHDGPQLHERGNYKDGRLRGSYEVFHENGQLWMETTYPKGDVWSCFGPKGVASPKGNAVGQCPPWPDFH